MNEEVYEYLKEYGFKKEEIHSFLDENEKMFFTSIKEVNKNINFLNEKGLTKEEIMNLLIKDPYMLTVKDNRLEALDKIYLDDLKYDLISLKKIIINNPDTYISSPIELNKNIDFLKKNGYSIQKIKELFLKAPLLVSMTPEEFKSYFIKK